MNEQEMIDLCKKHTMYSWAAGDAVDPYPIERTDGIYMYGPSGQKWIDFNSQLMSVNIGHNHPKVVKAIQEGDRAVLGSGWEDTGFVLVLPHGRPPNPDSITQRFRRDCERAGIRYITFHGLRRTFATLSLIAKVPVHFVSSSLGHGSVAVTLSQYAFVFPRASVEFMEQAGKYIFSGGSKRPQ